MPGPFMPGMPPPNPGYLQVMIFMVIMMIFMVIMMIIMVIMMMFMVMVLIISADAIILPLLSLWSPEPGAVPQLEGLGDEDLVGAADHRKDLAPGFTSVM